MTVLDAPRAWWDEGGRNTLFRRVRLEDAEVCIQFTFRTFSTFLHAAQLSRPATS